MYLYCISPISLVTRVLVEDDVYRRYNASSLKYRTERALRKKEREREGERERNRAYREVLRSSSVRRGPNPEPGLQITINFWRRASMLGLGNIKTLSHAALYPVNWCVEGCIARLTSPRRNDHDSARSRDKALAYDMPTVLFS